MSILSTIPAEAFDLIGVTGFGLYVLNYSLLTLRKISADQTRYFVLNMLAASMVMVGLMSAFNLASALIQGFWIVISIVGIATRLRQHAARVQSPAVAHARYGAIENRIVPRFVSRQRPAGRWADGFQETYRPDLGSGRKIPLHAVD